MRPFDRRTTSSRESRLLDVLRRHRGTADLHSGELSELIPAFPLKIQVQTPTRCTAACVMCPHEGITSQSGVAHHQMDETLYLEILTQLRERDVERLSLFLMNEPLLDVRMADWVSLARQALPRVTLGLFTNGSPLSPALARRLAASGLDELCISFHGFDAEAYEHVMKGLSYERGRRNVEQVLELHRAGELADMHLQLITGDLPEIDPSGALADPLLRDYIQLKPFSNERTVTGVATEPPIRAKETSQDGICQR